MIRWLKGTVRATALDSIVLDVGGVGYHVLAPIADVGRASIGSVVELHIHMHVREDALLLYGFATNDGLQLFERVLSVQGVGPKMGLAMLSAMSSEELVSAIAHGDEARLTRIPGVGKKTAARIILELADKLSKTATVAGGPATAGGGLVDDLRSALMHLGYKGPSVERALKKLQPQIDDGAKLDVLVREALKVVG